MLAYLLLVLPGLAPSLDLSVLPAHLAAVAGVAFPEPLPNIQATRERGGRLPGLAGVAFLLGVTACN